MSNASANKRGNSFESITTPRGTAVGFIYLSEPDPGQEDWGDYTPKYKLDIALDEGQEDKIIRKIDEAFAKAKKEAEERAREQAKGGRKKSPSPVDPPYFPEVDYETEEETGRTVFRTGAKSEGRNPKTKKPYTRTIPIFDAMKGKVQVDVGRGSVVKANITIAPWVNPKLEYGVALRLNAVQVIELVPPFSGGTADKYGFDEEEDGEDLSGQSAASTTEDEDGSETEGSTDGESELDDDIPF